MNKINKNESLGLSLDEEIEAGLNASNEELNEAISKKAKKIAKNIGRSIRTAAATIGGTATGLLAGGPVGGAIGGLAGFTVGAAEHAAKNAVEDNMNEEYSDYELLNFLEESGYEATMKNLLILKEGLKDGSIQLQKETPEKVSEAEKELEQEHLEGEEAAHKAEPILAKDSKEKEEKSVIVKESIKPIRSHTDRFLKSYLIEDCRVSVKEAESLTEDEKVDTIKELAKAVGASITSKINDLDTSLADKSRGDIKNLKILQDLQTAITQLEAIVERSDSYSPDCKKYIGTIIKSILYLNQYSNVFKEAYRNKKTLLILKYETIIMSIVSSTAYLISQIVDFRSQTLGMKPMVEIEEIAPLKTLAQFNKSIDSGEFKIITNDVGVLREYYKELPVETLSIVSEASGIPGMVIDGLRSIYDGLDKNKITQLLYKATGVVVLLLSVRDAVYSLSRMKTRISDMTNMISNFANVNIGGGIKSLASFANRFVPDAESASEMASNEIEDDNRKLSTQLRAIKAAPIIDKPEEPIIPDVPVEPEKSSGIPTANDVFSFNF